MSSGGGKTTTSTQEVKLPEWVNTAGKQTFSDAQAAAAKNPIVSYGKPTAAGSNPNLDQATSAASSTFGTGAADLERARAYNQQGADARTGRVGADMWNPQAMAAYMNPNLEAVQGRTLDMMHRQNQQEIAGLGDQAGAAHAFGGTRQAVVEGATREGQDRNIMNYLADSNQRAYDDAYGKFASDRGAKMGAAGTNAGLDQADAARKLQAGSQSAGIGSTAQGMTSDQINNLVKTGAIDQSTADSLIKGDYSEFLRMQDAPMQRYQQLMGLLTGTPTNKTQTGTETSKTSSSLFGTIVGALATGASAFSDRRLKRDIERVGELIAGVGIYAYRYLWSQERHVGVMADEVQHVYPDAIGTAFGFNTVDYSKLGVA